jgi:putative ABC transport system permease protein
MLLPVSYLVRNLLRRGTRTVVTVLGIAAVTMLVVAMHAFATGLRAASTGSAHDDVMVVLGVSAEADLVRSVIPRGAAETAAAAAPGVLTVDGVRAASVELHIATRQGDQVGLLRGVTPAAYLVHRDVTVVAGREPRGPFELMVGALAGPRMGLAPERVALGQKLAIEHREWTIVGHFAAPGTAYEAETWGRLGDVMLATKREDVSCVVLRLADLAREPELRLFVGRRVDLEISVLPERELLQQLASAVGPIAALATWMAVLAVLAGAFACGNTMFAAVLARTRELATLRALGYTPFAVGCGLVQESLLVAFLGGGLGVVGALLVGDVAIRYPMGALRLEPELVSRALGLAAALASGMLGGLLPAVRAVRIPLVEAIGGRT